jgi:YD repeat-containing protein
VTETTFPDGSVWKARYEDKGNLIAEVDALGHKTEYLNSDDGLPHTIIDATHEYEANGQLHSRDTGRLVGSEAFRYDATALMEQEWLPKELGIARM